MLDNSDGQTQEKLNRRKHLRQLLQLADRRGSCYGAWLCSTLRHISKLGRTAFPIDAWLKSTKCNEYNKLSDWEYHFLEQYHLPKHRILAAAIFVYAFLTSGALLSFLQGLPQAFGGLFWIGSVIGATGLLLDKNWGRLLTMLAAGGSLLAKIATAHGEGIETATIPAAWFLIGLLNELPTLAILISSFLIKVRVTSHTEDSSTSEITNKPRISIRTRHDIAYTSFLALGAISLWTSFFVYMEIQAASGGTGGVDGVLGFLVLIPFGVPLSIALIIGPVLSMFLWRDYRLVIMTALTIPLLIALVKLDYKMWSPVLLAYAIFCLGIAYMWFGKYRKRFDSTVKPATPTE